MTDDLLLGLQSKEFSEHLALTLSVPPQILMELAELVNSSSGFSIDDETSLLKVWEKTGRTAEDLKSLLSVVFHLYKAILVKDLVIDSVVEELDEYCTKNDIKGFTDCKSALVRFISPDASMYEKKNYAPYIAGVVDNLSSISGVVQLRAAFTDSESDEIVGFVPVLQVRLSAENDLENNKQFFTVQLNEKGLRQLIDSLECYAKQMESVRDTLSETVNIFDVNSVES